MSRSVSLKIGHHRCKHYFNENEEMKGNNSKCLFYGGLSIKKLLTLFDLKEGTVRTIYILNAARLVTGWNWYFMSSKGGQSNPQVIFFYSSSLQLDNFFPFFCWFRRLFNASHCHIALGCMTTYQTSSAFPDVRSCRNGLISNSGGLGTSACVKTTQDPDGQKDKTELCKMILLTQHTLRINFDYIASSVLALPCP